MYKLKEKVESESEVRPIFKFDETEVEQKNYRQYNNQ
jgi:hypothetical protein